MSENILNAILENASPRIIAENNDLGSIATGGNPSDPTGIKAQIASLRNGGGWDSAEYGISREEQIARLEAADTPEAQAKAMADLRVRAIRRASLDVTNGKVSVMVAVGPNGEKMPWHKLGTMVAAAVNSSEALALAGLGWKVLKVPAEREWNGKRVVSQDTFLLVRDDTGAELGSVGKVYKAVQNQDATRFLDEALVDFGARYETAGAVYGGKSVWFQARLPKQIEVRKGDMVDGFATFTLSHDGTAACRCYPTTLRAVCANTLRLANNEGKQKGISIRHTGDIKTKLNDARRALGLAVKGFETFAVKATAMANRPVKILPYANLVLDQILEISAADAKLGAAGMVDRDILAATLVRTDAEKEMMAKTYQKQIDKRDNLLSDILDRFDGERCGKGTLWDGVNAITEAADWSPKFRRYVGDNKDSGRFESVLTGDADEMKQAAWATALKAV